MPTYEYACTSCDQHVDVVQSFSDDPLTTCPSCGGTLRKVYAPVGIVLKGSGFYKTDSRTAKNGGRSDGGRSDGDGSSSGADSAKDGSSAGSTEKSPDGAKNGDGGSDSKESKGGGGGDSSSGSSTPAAAASS
jgi:putative FmdB family regulatory protein